MRTYLAVIAVITSAAATVRADVTIRYRIEMSNPTRQSAGRITSTVIHMKGNKGVTIDDGETTIVDFARQQVTLIDTVRRKYAVIPAADFAGKMTEVMNDMMPEAVQSGEVAEMLKSMKTTCETKTSGITETIQGVQAEEREVSCTMTMAMPDNMQGVMPAMSTKFITRIWTASPSERLRVPGLWQLSGFELWQHNFMNPAGALDKIVPDVMKPMMEALQKDQSAVLRSTTEMSMQMPMPGMPAGDKPLMKMSREVVGLSTELLDDSLFSVPPDCSPEPFAELTKGITSAQVASFKGQPETPAAPASASPAIPDDVKAFIPTLFPLSEHEPAVVVGADGKKLQGMVELLVTVGPKGSVEQTEVLTGPEGLRKSAMDTVRQWTYRPVIRNGAAVTAYTQASVDFTDYSKGVPDTGAFEFTPDMAAAQERLMRLEKTWPRSPEQEIADIEQDPGGADKSRRYDRLSDLALKSAQIGDNDKAKSYATELLAGAQEDAGDWNYGNAIHAGHSVLGLVALRGGDVSRAREQLLEAGKTPGSPQLDSFGPNMMLAAELLKKGESDVVLQYFDLCRKFWKMGGTQLDSWSETVRKGGKPALPTNMPQ